MTEPPSILFIDGACDLDLPRNKVSSFYWGWAMTQTNQRGSIRTLNGGLYHTRRCLGAVQCPRCRYTVAPNSSMSRPQLGRARGGEAPVEPVSSAPLLLCWSMPRPWSRRRATGLRHVPRCLESGLQKQGEDLVHFTQSGDHPHRQPPRLHATAAEMDELKKQSD